MDENYLDRLLQEVESKDIMLEEPEPSKKKKESPVVSDARTESDTQDEKEIVEERIVEDAERVPDVALSDAEIPVEEISELDELDELADLDMDSLNFDDIDFDDIDVMNININTSQFEKELEDLDHLSIDEMYLDDTDDSAFEEELNKVKQDNRSLEELAEETPDVSEDIPDAIPEMVNTLDSEPIPEMVNTLDSEPIPDSPVDDLADLLNAMESEENTASTDPQDIQTFGDVLTPEDMDAMLHGKPVGGDGTETGSLDSGDNLEANLDANIEADLAGAESGEGDFDLDSLMSEVFGDDIPTDLQEDTGAGDGANAATDVAGSGDNGVGDDMADLLSMLGMESTDIPTSSTPAGDELPDFDIPDELADVKDINVPKKKKNKFLEVLFGPDDDDEDALTPEQEAEIQKAKEEKKQAKLEKKNAAKEESKKKKAANAEKAAKNKEDKKAKAEAKKARLAAEEAKELEEEGPVKPLNTTLVAIVIVVFLAIGGFVIVGTQLFDYQLVITKASNYFNREKYGLAYREIHGVEVKPKDEELAAQIYTVMYIERQYESYQNYVKMNRPEMALDALIQAEGKYEEHHQQAINLGIEAQYDGVHNKILTVLSTEFGISSDRAKELLQLEPVVYTEEILKLTDSVDFAPSEEDFYTKDESDDAGDSESTSEE